MLQKAIFSMDSIEVKVQLAPFAVKRHLSFKKENGHADFEIRQSPTCIICCVNATDLTKKIAVPTPRLPSYTKKWLYFSGQSVPRLFK